MIAKGNLHAHGRKLAAYLLASKEDERAELMELRGFVAENLRDAFLDVQIQAEATRATKPFFHAYVRLPAHEALTREQWHEIADRIEQRLGFEGQPRAIAVHHKHEGGVHIHVAWSRIDQEQMKAIDPGLYKNKLKELCRELEKEFGLTEVRNERDPADKTKSADRDEFEQARRLGTDLKAIRAGIRDCWDSADSGKAFTAALDERGLILARGDRRDFVVVDHAGGEHALGKRITGATAAETRARLADLDRAALPSVDDAKDLQRERQQEGKAMSDAADDRGGPAVTATEEEARRQEAQRVEEQRRADARRAEEQRRETQRHEEEARAAQQTEAERQTQRNADRLVEQTEQLQQERERLQAYEKTLEEQARAARAAKAREEIEQQHRIDRERGGVRDAGERYSQALGQHYDIRDPYGSLARAAMAEHAAFRRDRAALDRQIEAEKDPAKRERLELRQKIELADYMAITSDRIAMQSEVITGRSNGTEAVKQRERAVAFRAESKRLRDELRDRAAEADKPAATAKAPEPDKAPPTPSPEPAKEAGSTQPQPQPQQPRPQPQQTQAVPPRDQPAFVVMRQEPAPDPYVKLATDELARRGAEAPPRQFSPVEFATKPEARRAFYEQQAAEQERVRQRNAAVDRIEQDMQAKKPVKARDLRQLSREDLKNIKQQGGSYLKEIIKQRQAERGKEAPRDSSQGRERER